jgi:hypothetical protein
MNMDVILGIGALGFGIYTIYVRQTSPEKFAKLSAMKEKWGAAAGTIVHWIAYTLVPIAAGIVFLFRGLSAQ